MNFLLSGIKPVVPLFLMLSVGAFAQNTAVESPERHQKYTVRLGYFVRTGTLGKPTNTYLNLNGIYEHLHSGGTGLGAGLRYQHLPFKPACSLSFVGRYDHIGADFTTRSDNKKGFLFDVEAAVSFIPFQEFRRFYIGANAGVNNLFKEVETLFEIPPDNEVIKLETDLQYFNYGLHAGVFIWKIGVESKLHFVPVKSYPFAKPEAKTILLLSGRVFYNLPID